MPYPTPLLDGVGNLLGAVHVLLEVADRQQKQAPREQAARCHRLAASVSDRQTTAILTTIAAEYEGKALLLEQVH